MTFVLDTTSRKIILDPTAGGGDLQFTASWADATATSLVEGASHGVGDAVNEVDVVAAPAASTRRIVKSITIHNASSTDSRSFILVYEDGASERIIARGTLTAGATWYSEQPNGGGGGGSGSVTSVGLSAASFLTVTNSPITSSGTIALALATQSPNAIFAGPSSGSTAVAPTFRSMVMADLPNQSGDRTGTGALVFATSPTLVTPVLGAASATSIAFGAGSASAPSITATGDTNTGIYFPTSDGFEVVTAGAGRVTIKTSTVDTSTAQLLVNISTSRINFYSNTIYEPIIQIEGTSFNSSALSFIRNENSAYSPAIIFGKSRSTTKGGNVTVQSGDQLGNFSFQGNDGVSFVEAVRVVSFVDGTPGLNDMPGALAVATTADGTSFVVERLRINNAGNVGIGTGTPTNLLDVNGTAIRIRTAGAPATAAAAGNQGEIRWGNLGGTDYIFVATGTNTWKRVAIATW